ncbi:MAG: ATP-binding protein [Christensenellales bacterium]|jgi:serine/threonine-protein kinase RsbT
MSEQTMLREVYPIEAGNFTSAGEASGQIKQILKKLGVPSNVVRRVSVAAYEVELNLVIHSHGGEMELKVLPDKVELDIRDRGPGIPNLDLAMKEGFSTATDDVRTMGFGAGMGLPNMRRNATSFSISSTVGVGTVIEMGFDL